MSYQVSKASEGRITAGRYKEGEMNRQACLDYLNENPGALGPEIINALGWDRVQGSVRLGKMAMNGEIERSGPVHCEGVNAVGVRFNYTTYAYKAKVKKTRSAAEITKSVTLNFVSSEDKYVRAYKTRQAILDMSHRIGPVNSTQVANELGISIDHATRSMASMAREGEMLKNANGKRITYMAIATKTLSGNEMRDRAKKNSSTQQPARKHTVQGSYIHTPGVYKNVKGHIQGQPIKNQGGQGSVRVGVYVGSSLA